MRLLYFLVWTLALPVMFGHLLWRARRQPDYLRHWGERLGWGPRLGPRRRILIHAVSVGETRAAAPLVKALQERYPEREILLTHTTPTGRETGRELFGDSVRQAYLPYDFAPLVALFLGRVRPDCCVVMETELWPECLLACHSRGIPAFLVNARLSERSAKGYRRFRPLVARALQSLAGLAAQTGPDGERLAQLGAEGIRITGNLKFDVAPPAGWETRAGELRKRFGDRFVFLAASTRDGEEAALLDALLPVDLAKLLIVIVPRHPQRFDEVARLIEARRVGWARRSAGGAGPDDLRVFLGDSMGELAAYYGAADVAYVGGSLVPLGGQNLIEAAAAGCPALIGPHTWNFTEAAEQAVAQGCALRVADHVELVAAVAALHADPARLTAMARAGLRFAEANRGATARVMDLIASGLARTERASRT